MIRLIQRRLIVPRGDTGTFSIPVLAGKDNGDASVFTIFDPLTHRKVFEKVMELSDGALTMDLTHGDTVNLPVGQYVWDIKFYTDAVFDGDGRVASGTEVDSYYAAFQLPICEIRETGDNLLLADDAPDARLAPDQINYLDLVRGQVQEYAEGAANSAAEADTSATNAENSASAAAASLQAAQDIETSVLAAQETASAAAVSAQESADLATQKAAQIEADLESKADKSEIPTKISDLTDDSGHYTKPASGIPASDLEETYLTEHQDLSNYVQKTDYATYSTAGIVKINIDNGIKLIDNTLAIAAVQNNIIKSGVGITSPLVVQQQHRATFYGLAKAAGSDEKDSTLPVGQYTDAAKAAIQQMLGVPSTSDIPTNVSDLTNDAGYLTEHQDISGKANVADLATVATSGDYDDLINKPTIPEAPVQDVQVNGSSILNNGIANISLANSSTPGVIKVDSSKGITTVLSGTTLAIASANDAAVKAGTDVYKPIVASRSHMSAFYGLAKAAGDSTQSSSNNAVGTYTADAKAAIQQMLDVPSTSAVTNEIATAIGNINSFDMAVVQALPTQDISTHTIYLVPKTGETNDVYDEYVYINSAWEMVGNTQIDLSNYATKSEIPTVPVQDVQVNGISILANGIANVVQIVTATNGKYGIMASNGTLYTSSASVNLLKQDYSTASSDDKTRMVYQPITPRRLSEAAFYGLAKAAGDTTQSQSNNAVGTYTTEAKAAIRSMIGAAASADISVQDVQVNGSSILSNGIANIPIASNSAAGVVKTDSINGVSITNNGFLVLPSPTDEQIKAGTNAAIALKPRHQHIAAFYGLAKAAGDTTQSQSANAVGIYTDEAKAAILDMFGLQFATAQDIQNIINGGVSA